MTTRIVLADDHPLILGGLEQLLELERDLAIVARCNRGDEALDVIRREHPDVVIADLSMPGMTGLELLRELEGTTRVILLSARIQPEQAREALRHGAAGIILKESAATLILDCLHAVLAGDDWIDPILARRMLRDNAGAATGDLTARETEVVRMVAAGLRNKEIADALSITEGTVKAHLRSIFEKLRIDSRMKLSVYAREHGLTA